MSRDPARRRPGVEVRAHPRSAFDFRVNTMTYRPGAALPFVEMHVMGMGC
jgi:glyoxylate utilization-related uncharacterized protein